MAGRIDRAVEDVGKGSTTLGAAAAGPESGLDLGEVILLVAVGIGIHARRGEVGIVLVEESQLHRVGGVDDKDDLLEVLAGVVDQGELGVVEGQARTVVLAGTGIHGLIVSFAGVSLDGDDGRAVFIEGILDILECRGKIGKVALGVGIDFIDFRIGAEGILDTFAEGDGAVCRGRVFAAGHVVVPGVVAKDRDLLRLGKGKGVFFVLQKGDTLFGRALGDFLGILQGLFLRVGLVVVIVSCQAGAIIVDDGLAREEEVEVLGLHARSDLDSGDDDKKAGADGT